MSPPFGRARPEAHLGPGLDEPVAGARGPRDGRLEQRLRRSQPAALQQRIPQIDLELDPRPVALLEQGRPARAGCSRPPCHRGRAHACPQCRASRLPVGEGCLGRPELGGVEGGLLEVVAEDLLELLADALAVEPVGETLVQLGSQPLRHRLVRRVADEDVTEAEAVVAGETRAVGADELLAHEREQVRADRRPLRPGRSSVTAPRWNSRPSTEARSITERSSGSSRSMRAASSAWIVGGIVEPRRRRLRRASRASCSTKSGLPSAASTICAARRLVAPLRRCVDEPLQSSSASGSSATSVAFGRGVDPGRAVLEQVGTRECRGRAAARRARTSRRTRAGRAASARAQWMSSSTTISGRSARAPRTACATAQAISSRRSVLRRPPASPRAQPIRDERRPRRRESSSIAVAGIVAGDLRDDLGQAASR